MIREAENLDNAKITVFLKNGVVYAKEDVPPNPISEQGGIITFWVDEKLFNIPLSSVDHFFFTFDEDEDSCSL
jgi:hypothetical protein